MKKSIFIRLSIIVVLFFIVPDLIAQCPMCKMAAQSNMNNGGTAGKGLNFGILYILSLPYLLVMTLGYLWWRNRKKGVDEEPVIRSNSDYTFSEN